MTDHVPTEPQSPSSPFYTGLPPPLPPTPAAGGQPQPSQSSSSRRRPRYNVFGHYVLMQTIGEGEFAKVKFAVERQSGTEVAIKLIKKESIDSEAKLSKINREISALKSVRHPHIVQLYEIIETDRYIGIVMEYASGGELFDYILAHRFLREKEAGRLFAQLISGVDYLHKQHIVHRDLKLENLLLDNHRDLKITDFGFANQFRKATEDLMATSCGSPCYAAPELVVNDGMYVGTAVDIWSCGVILYAMLAGYLPFDDDPTNPDGDNINQLYKYILTTPLVFPDYISSSARDLLRRMLVPDPIQRCDIRAIMAHEWLSAFSYIFDLPSQEQIVPNMDPVPVLVVEPTPLASTPPDLTIPSEEARKAKAQKRHTIQVEYDVDTLAAFAQLDDDIKAVAAANADAIIPATVDPIPVPAPIPAADNTVAPPDSPVDPYCIPSVDQSSTTRSEEPAAMSEKPPTDIQPVPRESAKADSGTAVEPDEPSKVIDDEGIAAVDVAPVHRSSDLTSGTRTPTTVRITEPAPSTESHSNPPTKATVPTKRRKAHSVLVTSNTLAALNGRDSETSEFDHKAAAAAAVAAVSASNPAKRVMDWFRRKSNAPKVEVAPISTNPSAAVSGDQLPTTIKKPEALDDNPKLKLHRGAVDQNSLTSLPPDEVFQRVKQIIFDMGLEVYKESDYKIKCIRPSSKAIPVESTSSSPAGPAAKKPPPHLGLVAPRPSEASPTSPELSPTTVEGNAIPLPTKVRVHRPSTSHTIPSPFSGSGVFSRLSLAIGGGSTKGSSLHSDSKAELPLRTTSPELQRHSVDSARVPSPEVPADCTAASVYQRKRQSTFMRFIPFGQASHSQSKSAGISSTDVTVSGSMAGHRTKRQGGAKFAAEVPLAKKLSNDLLAKLAEPEPASGSPAGPQTVSDNGSVHSSQGRLPATTGAASSNDPMLNHRRNKSTGTVSFVSVQNCSQASGDPETKEANGAPASAGIPRPSHDSSVTSLLNHSRDHLSTHSADSPRLPLRGIREQPAPVYGELYIDAAGEVRLTVDICKLKNLPHLLTVRVRRQRGNIWSYKFLYNEFFKRLDVNQGASSTVPVTSMAAGEEDMAEGTTAGPSVGSTHYKVTGSVSGVDLSQQDKPEIPSRTSLSLQHKPAATTTGVTGSSRQAKRASIFHPSSLFSTSNGVGRFIGRNSSDSKHAPNLKEIFTGKHEA
ncbi:hypothetical protein H4R33_002040 [Dimargaris cristalligena]|nr:hypothetical protein H4R33_002040 [Dimargaris cristalligena]